MIKLVLSDIDGTLIPFGQEHADERTMAAIATLRESGIRFGLATGRDVMELTAQFCGDTTPFETGILSNGKKIMVDGELVRLTLVENYGLSRMAQMVREYPGCFVTAYPLETDASNPIYCVGTTPEEMAPWADVYSFNGIIVDDVPDVDVIGATIACPTDEKTMLEIIERGKELCPQFDFLRPAPLWTDIVPKGVNKGTMLAVLLKELGIGYDEVMMFGDADNDLAILSAVENSVVVANGTPAAKAAAAWHIGASEDGAVAQALEELAAGGRLLSAVRSR